MHQTLSEINQGMLPYVPGRRIQNYNNDCPNTLAVFRIRKYWSRDYQEISSH